MKRNIIISDLFLVDCSIHHKLEKYVRQFGILGSGGPNLNACVKRWVQRGTVFFSVRKLESLCHGPDSASDDFCCLGKKPAAVCIMPGVCTRIQEVREQGTFLLIHVPLYRPWTWVQALISSTWRGCSLLVTTGRSTEWYLCFCTQKDQVSCNMLWNSKQCIGPKEAAIKVKDWEGEENTCNRAAGVLWESVIEGKSNKDQIYKQKVRAVSMQLST